jgi:hypothetical protein
MASDDDRDDIAWPHFDVMSINGNAVNAGMAMLNQCRG